MYGTIDSMVIGDIVFKNPNIIIGLSNSEIDTIFQIDAILGIDFIRKIGETNIYPKEKKIIFPVNKTQFSKTGRNLMFSGGQSYLKAYSGNEELLLHFDTGGAKTDLFDTYYRKHKEKFDTSGNKRLIGRGGYGGARRIEAFNIPVFPLVIVNQSFELRDVDVLTEKSTAFQNNEDGSLGLDFATSFEKIIINYDDMFLQVEK